MTPMPPSRRTRRVLTDRRPAPRPACARCPTPMAHRRSPDRRCAAHVRRRTALLARLHEAVGRGRPR